MKRSEVRAFIKAGVEALTGKYYFRSGRVTELNSNRSNEYPLIWLITPQTDVSFINALPVDSWQIQIQILMKDAAGSSPEEYEAIVDKCDSIAQKLTYKYNQVVSGSATSIIEGISRQPIIHKLADDTTGVLLSFTLIAPDTTANCDD